MNTTCSSVSNSLLCLPARAVGGRAARTALPRSTTRASPSHLTRASLAADKSMKRGDIEEYFFGAAWEKPEGMHMMAQQALSAGVMASTLPASGLPAEVRLSRALALGFGEGTPGFLFPLQGPCAHHPTSRSFPQWFFRCWVAPSAPATSRGGRGRNP